MHRGLSLFLLERSIWMFAPAFPLVLASAMTTLPKATAVSPKAAASPASVASPRARVGDPEKTPRRGKKHTLTQDYIQARSALEVSAKVALKALKQVQSAKKSEFRKRQRIVAKAQALEMDTLVKIIEMKADLPNIECPNCQSCFAPALPIVDAFRAVKAGRELHPESPGKKLFVSSPSTPKPGAHSSLSK